MKIPNRIQSLLEKREKYACKLMEIESELDNWIEKHGGCLGDPDVCDSVLSGCMIYFEPSNAKLSVERYIKDKM